MDPARALPRRRLLRRNRTDSEATLWSWLRARRFAGFKFRRQYACGPYILDFYCPARHLAVEVDRGHHFDPDVRAYEDRRAAYLRRRGVHVIRFRAEVVARERLRVLEAIAAALGVGACGTPR